MRSVEGSSVVREFAEAYFNYDFDRAMACVTPESRKWLHFAASNVTEQDVAILREQSEPASVEVTATGVLNDSLSEAFVTVSRFLQPDSIDRPGQITDEARFYFVLVKRSGKWYVRMEGLPRSETPGLD